MNHIKIIKELCQYKALNDRVQWHPHVMAECVKTNQEIKYPDGGSWPVFEIECLKDQNLIEIDLIQDRRGTVKKWLSNLSLNDEFLLSFINVFDLEIKYHKTNTLQIISKGKRQLHPELSCAKFSLKKCNNCKHIYMVLFATRSESGRDDENVIYVEGIYQVDLSLKFQEYLNI